MRTIPTAIHHNSTHQIVQKISKDKQKRTQWSVLCMFLAPQLLLTQFFHFCSLVMVVSLQIQSQSPSCNYEQYHVVTLVMPHCQSKLCQPHPSPSQVQRTKTAPVDQMRLLKPLRTSQEQQPTIGKQSDKAMEFVMKRELSKPVNPELNN